MRLVTIAFALLLTACHLPPDTPMQFNTVCIQGVRYYVGSHQLAPAFNRDGTVQLCGTGTSWKPIKSY